MRTTKCSPKSLACALASLLLAVAAAATAVALTPTASAAASDPYNWKNVQIAGGGFVPGIIFNQREQNLIYARTDIGGAYRWNQSSQTWTPLLDWVGWNNWGYNGVVSMATDEVDPNRVYAAVGMYTNSWDPNNGAILRSTNRGTSWQVSPLPFKLGGNMPGRGMGERLAVDPNRNSVLYFGAPSGNGLWRSTDSGATWSRVTNFPNAGNYVAQPGDHYLGYSGLTIDRQRPSTIMVATQISWWPDAIFFRSTDSGATWTRVWDFTSYPNRSFRYTQNISSVPWLTFGTNPQPPEVTPKLGWMNASVEIDPFNSGRMMYGTGATIYGTTNLTNWDSGGQFTITPMVKGLEETAVLDLISPPSGAPLVSGLGDIGGFRHTNLDAIPPMMFTSPYFTSTTSLDFAEASPSTMVRAGNFTDSDRPNDSHVAFSTDGGANWFQGGEPGGVNSGGTVAAAAGGGRFVWAPGDPGQPVVYSVGFGTSWSQASGVPANAIVESDRVNPGKFYAFSNGTFYVSTNGGQTFSSTGATGLPSSGVRFKAMPGREGDIWLAGSTGLFHSTNSGASFTRLSNVTSGINVGFGRAAPGQTYMALFLAGTVDGVTGVYRSDNAGATWLRINDDQHQYGNMGEALTGDPRIWGRVYLGTNGRGGLYAHRPGGPPPPPTPPTPTTTPPPTGRSR